MSAPTRALHTPHVRFARSMASLGFAVVLITDTPLVRAEDLPRPRPGEWSVLLGVGVGAKPEYEGSSSIDLSPLPLVDIRYRPDLPLLHTVFASTLDGIGLLFADSRSFRLGASLAYDSGRSDSKDRRLNGLGDIGGGPELRVFASTSVGPARIQLSGRRSFGELDDTTISLSASHRWRVTEKLRLRLKLAGEWADSRHMEGYFGVTPAQSVSSGLARHEADAGFKSVQLSLYGAYNLSPNWVVIAVAGMGYLVGDAADSPVVETDWQPFGMLGTAYRF
jgi:outer membrane scaffolding protein for murein synthesis (MipA/OmpV family)